MELKTLRDICRDANVSRRAVQGYERHGLVAHTKKDKYGRLLYDEYSQNRIKQIKLYQKMGFTVNEIANIIDADASIKKDAIQAKIALLRKEYEQLPELMARAEALLNSIK